jgi:hypothetical protein
MPAKQEFSCGSAAILAYTAVFVAAIICIFYCFFPFFHKKLGRTEKIKVLMPVIRNLLK